MNYRSRMLVGWRAWIRALLLVGLLCSVSTPVLSDSPQLGAPAQMPANPARSPMSAQGSTLAQPRIRLHIPVVWYPLGGLKIDPQSREESRLAFISEYLGTEVSETGWLGLHASCDPGATEQDFRDSVMRRINYFRAMAGVPANVTLPEAYNREAQAAALIMSANIALSHRPPSSWKCYSQLGFDGAGSSNLALGVAGPSAIRLYMLDPGEGNDAVGHRRWILYPQIRYMGTGDVPSTSGYPSANALHVFDEHLWDPRPSTRDEFVAWPPPGYVPYPVVFARWSFSYAGADFSSATVLMYCGVRSLPVAVSPQTAGYGDSTLVWIPDGMRDGAVWQRPEADLRCTVSVHDVLIGGQPRDFAYNVVIFDPGM